MSVVRQANLHEGQQVRVSASFCLLTQPQEALLQLAPASSICHEGCQASPFGHISLQLLQLPLGQPCRAAGKLSSLLAAHDKPMQDACGVNLAEGSD